MSRSRFPLASLLDLFGEVRIQPGPGNAYCVGSKRHIMLGIVCDLCFFYGCSCLSCSNFVVSLPTPVAAWVRWCCCRVQFCNDIAYAGEEDCGM